MNEQNIPSNNVQVQNPKNFWIIIAAIVTTAIVVGSIMYIWQTSNLKLVEQSTQKQITLLQNQISQLQQAQQNQPVAQPSTNQNQNNQPAVDLSQNTNQPVSQPQEIVYKNSAYGFTLTFPLTWKGYVTKNRTINWGDSFNPSDSIDFGISAVQDSLFNVSIFTKEQWELLNKFYEGPLPSKIGESGQYVFGYNHAGDAINAIAAARMNELPAIVKTFTATK